MNEIMAQSFNYDVSLMIATYGAAIAVTMIKVVVLFLLMRFLDRLTKVKFDETRASIYKDANVAVAVYRGFWVLAVACIVGLSG